MNLKKLHLTLWRKIMTKDQFIDALRQGLKKHNIKDVDDIIRDYEDYFKEQLSLGKKESEISLKLGDLKSIINDYAESSSNTKKKWFDLVTVGFIAIPLLIILYGLLISFFGGALATWGIAIYYLFRLDSLSFMPHIPTGVHLIYVLMMLAWSIFFFSLSIRFAATIKSMTTQYVVKQTIRIGDYHIKDIYIKLFNYSLIIGSSLFVIGYAISALIAKDFQYWHVWDWFN